MNQSVTEQVIAEGDENRINEVVVFTQHAYLKRQVATHTQLGFNRFFIEINAFSIDSNSVQAAVYGDGEILSVQYKEMPVLAENIKQLDIKNLQTEQRQLTKQCRILEYKRENCLKQKKFLDSAINLSNLPIVEFRTQQSKTEALKDSLANLKEMLGLLSQNYSEILQQEEEITTELEKVTEQLSVVKNKLVLLEPQSAASHKTIELLFDAKKTESIKIELSYIAYHACWKPVYKVDVSMDLSQIMMTMFAHIEQTSGENWQGVSLSVSNALPNTTGTHLPELNSWRIGAVPAAMAKMSKRVARGATEVESMFTESSDINLPDDEDEFSVAGKDGSFTFGGESSFLSDDGDYDSFEADRNEYDPAAEADVYMAYGRYEQAEELMRRAVKEHPDNKEYQAKLEEVLAMTGNPKNRVEKPQSAPQNAAKPEQEAKFSQAQQIQSSLAFEYQLPVPIDISSGGGETLLPMSSKNLTSKFFYYAVPKQNSLVYLVCESDLESSLLSGQLNIHLGGRFVGNTFLDEKKAGKTLLINLGPAHDVKIQREKITDELAESFLAGMMDRLSVARKLEFRIVVENLKDEAIEVKIMDAIPVADTDRIQVKNLTIKPEPEIKDWQKRKGVMQWHLSLAAKETQEIYIQFFIKHPKDYALRLS
jgi:tetratricopeptide (TPR) repeat protein